MLLPLITKTKDQYRTEIDVYIYIHGFDRSLIVRELVYYNINI